MKKEKRCPVCALERNKLIKCKECKRDVCLECVDDDNVCLDCISEEMEDDIY